MYTTEYIIHDPSEYGKPGMLTCIVDGSASPEIAVQVTWWAQGRELENGNKYLMDFEPSEEKGVLVYRLTVNDIQHSDIGSYLCRLATEFSIEDSQHAWIKSDFRNGERRCCFWNYLLPFHGGSHVTASIQHNKQVKDWVTTGSIMRVSSRVYYSCVHIFQLLQWI